MCWKDSTAIDCGRFLAFMDLISYLGEIIVHLPGSNISVHVQRVSTEKDEKGLTVAFHLENWSCPQTKIWFARHLMVCPTVFLFWFPRKSVSRFGSVSINDEHTLQITLHSLKQQIQFPTLWSLHFPGKFWTLGIEATQRTERDKRIVLRQFYFNQPICFHTIDPWKRLACYPEKSLLVQVDLLDSQSRSTSM